MKKALVGILVTALVMGAGWGFETKLYQNKLEQAELRYEEMTQKCEDETQYAKYWQEQIWKVMNDEDYDFEIRHDNQLHRYTAEKKNFLYTKKEHEITK